MTQSPINTVKQILESLDLEPFGRVSEKISERGIEAERQAVANFAIEGIELGEEVRAINAFVRKHNLDKDAAAEIGLHVFCALNNIDRSAVAETG